MQDTEKPTGRGMGCYRPEVQGRSSAAIERSLQTLERPFPSSLPQRPSQTFLLPLIRVVRAEMLMVQRQLTHRRGRWSSRDLLSGAWESWGPTDP